MCADAGTSVSSRLSVNSSDHFGRNRKRFPDASSSLRERAGLEEVLGESCGGDVEDELALELAVVGSLFFLQYGPHDISVLNFPYAVS